MINDDFVYIMRKYNLEIQQPNILYEMKIFYNY